MKTVKRICLGFVVILSAVVLALCCVFFRDASLQRKLVGTWSGDCVLPNGIRAQEMLWVDANGCYVQNVTNILTNGIRTSGCYAGTLRVVNGRLIDTVTNDFGGNCLVPRVQSCDKIIRLDATELVTKARLCNAVYRREPGGAK